MNSPKSNEQEFSECIRIRGARVHNLRGIDVEIPHDSLVVVTGVSGSGKSSLAFDTIFAEGQRRYLESLSTYTRQFLDQLERPEVDLIDGLPPTLSVEQQSGTAQQRSTLATVTEIYDYLRLLYSRAGQAHCTNCGHPLSQQSSQAIVDEVLNFDDRCKVMILAPLVIGRKGAHAKIFEQIRKEGFVRARVDGEIVDVAESPKLAKGVLHNIEAVIDRVIMKEGIRPRLQESIDLAVKQGNGTCLISYEKDGGWKDRLFSSRFACIDCGISFTELEPRTFSFNSPYGACPDCQGLGFQSDVEENGKKQKEEADERNSKICTTCQGARIGPVGRSVTLAGMPIHHLTSMNVSEAAQFVSNISEQINSGSDGLELTTEGELAASKAIPDVLSRLQFLEQVGLGYLTLNRSARTLSGGEFQRARLAGCLGSGLIGVCYVLDEPTIGLHPRDTNRLISTLEELRDRGNTVLVVEHDAEMMQRSDYLVDMGPGAGSEGGQIITAGAPVEVGQHPGSLTAQYLRNGLQISRDSISKSLNEKQSIRLSGAKLNNLKAVTIQIPLESMTVVTGVSGSGKSSLITRTLVPAIKSILNESGLTTGFFENIEGVEQLDRIIEIDQSPISRTGRSNPATYSGAWDEIRKVFAKTRDARLRGYKPRRFSFNAKQGRCEECAGQGTKRIEMNFLPDMYVLCSVCNGARFNRPTLSIRYRGRSVADVLKMRIDEAADFFDSFPRLHTILKTFVEVGLGYLGLGQSSLTLSGGEAQRVKLVTELSRGTSALLSGLNEENLNSNKQTTLFEKETNRPVPPEMARTLFVLDEPTTGLHAADIEKLAGLLSRLVTFGHTAVVIEHQIDLIAASDYVIDLGPEGGENGGNIVAAGTPKEVAAIELSHTGIALKEYFS